MTRTDVAEYWADIERWLLIHAPAAIPLLPPGASATVMDAAENRLGFALPYEVRDFLAVHDGSGGLWLHDRGEFMSLDSILSSWNLDFDLWGDGNNDEWANPHGPIKKHWFNRKWLPIVDARTGDYVCVDLDPPVGGEEGQLIAWYHDGGPRDVLASSFGGLLNEFVTELAGGRYAFKLDRAGVPYLDYTRP